VLNNRDHEKITDVKIPEPYKIHNLYQGQHKLTPMEKKRKKTNIINQYRDNTKK